MEFSPRNSPRTSPARRTPSPRSRVGDKKEKKDRLSNSRLSHRHGGPPSIGGGSSSLHSARSAFEKSPYGAYDSRGRSSFGHYGSRGGPSPSTPELNGILLRGSSASSGSGGWLPSGAVWGSNNSKKGKHKLSKKAGASSKGSARTRNINFLNASSHKDLSDRHGRKAKHQSDFSTRHGNNWIGNELVETATAFPRPLEKVSVSISKDKEKDKERGASNGKEDSHKHESSKSRKRSQPTRQSLRNTQTRSQRDRSKSWDPAARRRRDRKTAVERAYGGMGVVIPNVNKRSSNNSRAGSQRQREKERGGDNAKNVSSSSSTTKKTAASKTLSTADAPTPSRPSPVKHAQNVQKTATAVVTTATAAAVQSVKQSMAVTESDAMQQASLSPSGTQSTPAAGTPESLASHDVKEAIEAPTVTAGIKEAVNSGATSDASSGKMPAQELTQKNSKELGAAEASLAQSSSMAAAAVAASASENPIPLNQIDKLLVLLLKERERTVAASSQSYNNESEVAGFSGKFEPDAPIAPADNKEQLLAMLGGLKGQLHNIGREQHDRETNYIVQELEEEETDDDSDDDSNEDSDEGSEDDDNADYREDGEGSEQLEGDLQNSGESPFQYRAPLKDGSSRGSSGESRHKKKVKAKGKKMQRTGNASSDVKNGTMNRKGKREARKIRKKKSRKKTGGNVRSGKSDRTTVRRRPKSGPPAFLGGSQVFGVEPATVQLAEVLQTLNIMEGHENRSYRESFDCIEQEIRNQRYWPNPENSPGSRHQDPNEKHISHAERYQTKDRDGSRSTRAGNGNGGPAAVLQFAKSKLEKLEKAKAEQLLRRQQAQNAGLQDPQAFESQQTQQKGHPSPREQPAGEVIEASVQSKGPVPSEEQNYRSHRGPTRQVDSGRAHLGKNQMDSSVEKKRTPRGSVGNEVMAAISNSVSRVNSVAQRSSALAPASKMFRSSSETGSDVEGATDSYDGTTGDNAIQRSGPYGTTLVDGESSPIGETEDGTKKPALTPSAPTSGGLEGTTKTLPVPHGKNLHDGNSKPLAIKLPSTNSKTSMLNDASGSVSPAGQGAMSEYEEHLQSRAGRLEQREGATLKAYDMNDSARENEEDHNEIDPEMATVMQVGSPPKVGGGVPRLHLERMKALRSPHGSDDGNSASSKLGTLSPDPTKMMDISSPRSAFSRHSSRSDLASMCLATGVEEKEVPLGKTRSKFGLSRSVSC